MWCQMRGLPTTLRGITAAATLAGVVFAGTAAAAAAGPSGVVRSASAAGRAAAPAFSATRPATLDNLYGVSCVSGSFCVAVGAFVSRAGHDVVLAEAWNGASWRVLRSAEAAGLLDAVSCTSVSFCMAVGEAGAVAGPPLAEAWNGRTWRVVKAPPGGTDLSALSCAAASFCVGVPGTTVSTVAEEWNGRAWHLMNMSGDSCGRFLCVLYGVSCPRAQDCMAAGTYTNHAGTVVLGKALKWNGRTWRDTIPQSLAQNAGLAMISCPSASSCLAVGQQNAIAWDGSSWRQLAAPAALLVRGLSCPRPRSCMLVGGQGYGASPVSAQAWDGRTWRRLRPAQPGKSARVLFSVSCWRRPACMAVGSYSTMPTPFGDALTLAEQWNGTTWRVRSTPSPR
jgi:hypothetical protein